MPSAKAWTASSISSTAVEVDLVWLYESSPRVAVAFSSEFGVGNGLRGGVADEDFQRRLEGVH